MNKNDISPLLERYLSARIQGKDPYFDVDEIDELMYGLEGTDKEQYLDEILELGLRLHPGNLDLLIKKCASYTFRDDPESALVLMDSMGVTDNEDLDILRAECYCRQKRYDLLIEHVDTLINKKCTYIKNLFEMIAPVINDMEMTNEAHDFILRGLKLYPNNVILKEELCYALESKGDISGAIKLCNELIDKNPYSFEYWFALGRFYSLGAEYEKAIEALDFALTCTDSDPDINILKAYCLYMNGSYEKALEVYQELCSNKEFYDELQPFIAECYIKLKDYDSAYFTLRNYLKEKKFKDDANTLINYIRCCKEVGYEEEATYILEKAVEQYPNNINLLALQALNHVDHGEEALAIEATERLYDILDDDSKTLIQEDYDNLFSAGKFLYLKGQTDRAIKYFEKVYAGNPNHPYLHLHMALAYMVKGDMDKFEEHFKETSNKEMLDYIESLGFNFKEMEKLLFGKHIPPEDLTKEFLSNKDNNN